MRTNDESSCRHDSKLGTNLLRVLWFVFYTLVIFKKIITKFQTVQSIDYLGLVHTPDTVCLSQIVVFYQYQVCAIVYMMIAFRLPIRHSTSIP
jgi:uncharacterized protein YciW